MQSVLVRVELQGVTPLVWRRMRPPARWTLRQVHEAIQVAFGWEDRHLHEFQIARVRAGMPDADEESSDLQDDTEWTLREVVKAATKEFLYVYDFGDQWEHRIVVERESRASAGKLFAPVCLAGENAAPPEDVGGPPGYAEFVGALADPEHERHEELLTWVGGVFDADAFDLNRVNRELRRLSKGMIDQTQSERAQAVADQPRVASESSGVSGRCRGGMYQRIGTHNPSHRACSVAAFASKRGRRHVPARAATFANSRPIAGSLWGPLGFSE